MGWFVLCEELFQFQRIHCPGCPLRLLFPCAQLLRTYSIAPRTLTTTAWQQSPSFPPVDALMDKLQSVDWQRLATRLAAALMFTLALVHTLAQRLAPYVARALRSLADRLDSVATEQEIRRLAASGVSQRGIAAQLGISRHQVKQALA